jgi:hypothetical protein
MLREIHSAWLRLIPGVRESITSLAPDGQKRTGPMT